MTRLIDSRNPIDMSEQKKIDKITRVRRVFNSINVVTANSAFMGLTKHIEHAFSEKDLESMERSMRTLAGIMTQDARTQSVDPSNRKVLATLAGSINHELDKRF